MNMCCVNIKRNTFLGDRKKLTDLLVNRESITCSDSKPSPQDFPSGPVAKNSHFQGRGPGLDAWSGIPQTAAKSSQAATKNPKCFN